MFWTLAVNHNSTLTLIDLSMFAVDMAINFLTLEPIYDTCIKQQAETFLFNPIT